MKFLLQIWKKLPLKKSIRVFLLRRLNDQFLLGVTGVIFNEKNHVLLVKHTYRKMAWSLPGGYLKANEYPKEGLAREILEETGLKVEIIRIIKTTTHFDGRLDLSYFGVLRSGSFRPSEEVTAHRFVSVDKLPKLHSDQYDQIREGFERKKKHDTQQRWRSIKAVVPSFLKRFSLSK